MNYSSKVLATVSLRTAFHLSRKCKAQFGDGFDTRKLEDERVELIGPGYAQDFVDGFLAALEAIGWESSKEKTPTSSGEFTLGAHVYTDQKKAK